MKNPLLRKLLSIPLLFLSLQGCSLLSFKGEPDPQIPEWQEHKRNLNAIHQWNAEGRFAAKGNEESWTGNFRWFNDTGNYEVFISAPLSGGSFELTGNRQESKLTLDRDHIFTDDNANDLIHKYTGLKLPIDELQYWMLGLPSPYQRLDFIELDTQGKLARLKQSNWLINFKRYKQLDHVTIPNKIFLENHEFDVRLSIQRWILN